MNIIRLFLVAVVTFVVVAVFSFMYLRWWQAILVCVGVIALFVLAVRVAISMLIRKAGEAIGGAFNERGHVLRGAAVEVHSVEPDSTPPSQQQIEDIRAMREEQEPGYQRSEPVKKYYRMDVTVRAMPPAPVAGGDDVQRAVAAAGGTWTPHELVLVPFDEPTTPEDEKGVPMMVKMMKQFTSGYRPEQIVEPEDESTGGEGDVIEGPRSKRFQFSVGVPDGVRELKFKYYGESFGRIVLPASA
jgi:hypothetical protein